MLKSVHLTDYRCNLVSIAGFPVMTEEKPPGSSKSLDALEDSGRNETAHELQAEKLMNGGREAVIIHNGERYRLRITARSRLILTK